MNSIRIVTGGQTGVDRGALDAATECGVETGGWCPEGRMAEDGPIPSKYTVKELSGAGYAERTRQNVIDSDGTVVIYFDELVGGTAYTVECCAIEDKPHLCIDVWQIDGLEAVKQICRFMDENGIITLNVAGPRASEAAQGYDTAFAVLQGVLNRV